MPGLISRAETQQPLAPAWAPAPMPAHEAGSRPSQAQPLPSVPAMAHGTRPMAGPVAQLAARLALRSLHAELTLFPKPGLVSTVDSGSHADMDAGTFMRSLFCLRHYFRQITQAGMDDADFATLRQLGQAAEARMLLATRGVNTHRGAIFTLGLLCAAHGRLQARGEAVSASALRTQLRERWGDDLAQHAAITPALLKRCVASQGRAEELSHGLQVRARYAVAGAREQAAHGLPAVFELGLPRLQHRLQQGHVWRAAALETLFSLMAQVHDSNVLYRAGWRGMDLVQQQAQLFLAQGGCRREDWHARALACHRLFVANRLSPGGVADLFAATCFVHFATAEKRA